MEGEKRAAIYRRVSTIEQEENTSLENQEKQCRARAVGHGCTVVADEFDVHTGYKLETRRGLNAIRELIRSHAVDVVIIWRLDRLTRRMWDLPKLLDEAEQHGVAIASVTEQIDTSTPVGKMTAMALAFVAEQERETFRQRSESGRRIRAEHGKPLVGPRPPYGYRWVEGEPTRRGGREKIGLEPHPQTASVMMRIWTELAEKRSLREVCAGLTSDGIPTPTGKTQWDKSSIVRLVRNPVYWGQPANYRYSWHEETRTDQLSGITKTVKVVSPHDESMRIPLSTDVVPPLVDPDLAAMVLANLAENTHTAPRRNLCPEQYLLRGGFMHCGHCGRVMTCRLQRNRRTGHARLQYRCTTVGTKPGACVNNSIEAPGLDAAIWGWVEDTLRDPEIIAREVRRLTQGSADPTSTRRALLDRQQAEVER